MIDWPDLAANAMWVLGGALALAALSYAYWQAGAHGEQLRVALARPRLRIALDLAGVLVCLGLGLASRPVLEILLWLALAALFSLQLWRDLVEARRSA